MDFYALHLFHERSVMDRNPVWDIDIVYAVQYLFGDGEEFIFKLLEYSYWLLL